MTKGQNQMCFNQGKSFTDLEACFGLFHLEGREEHSILTPDHQLMTDVNSRVLGARININLPKNPP
jgi:hypothetical protein